jgi:hypothetical protein
MQHRHACLVLVVELLGFLDRGLLVQGAARASEEQVPAHKLGAEAEIHGDLAVIDMKP